MSVLEILQVLSNAAIAVVVPVLAWLAKRLMDQQTELLRARNELLRETQYDRAVALMQSQRTAYELERQHLETRIDQLTRDGASAGEELRIARERMQDLTRTVLAFEQDAATASREAMIRALFGSDVSLASERLSHKLDFANCRFEAPVSFQNVSFTGGVTFDGADLRKASFRGTYLQGVDLAVAHIDVATKVPRVHYGSGVRS